MSDTTVDKDAIIQYYTNNDGSINSLQAARGPISPALKAQITAAVDAATSDNDPATTAETATAEVLAAQPDAVFLSVKGTYYVAKVARYSGDSELLTPSPTLFMLLEKYGEMEVNEMNDMITQAAAAGIIG